MRWGSPVVRNNRALRGGARRGRNVAREGLGKQNILRRNKKGVWALSRVLDGRGGGRKGGGKAGGNVGGGVFVNGN